MRLTDLTSRLFSWLPAALLCLIPAIANGQTEWTSAGGGDFGTAVNWSSGVPTNGSTVLFGNALDADAIINLDIARTLDQVQFDNADFSYTLSGANALSLSGSAMLVVLAGEHQIDAQLMGGVGLTKSGPGAIALTNAANIYTGDTNILAGTLLFSGGGALGAIGGTTTVSAGGTLALTNGADASVETVYIAGNNAFDTAAVTGDASSVTIGGHVVGQVGGANYIVESAAGGTLNLPASISAPDAGERLVVFRGDGDFMVNQITDGTVDVGTGAITPSTVENIGVLKQGAGKLTINTQTDYNDDYHFGDTVVEKGILAVKSPNGTDGELRSTVFVREGATFDVTSFFTYNLQPTVASGEVGLGGGGMVNIGSGRTIGAFESSTITPGDGVGTLNITGNLSLTYFDSGNSTVPDSGSLNFELGNVAATIGGGENDLVDVSGTLTTTTSAGATGSSFIVNVTPAENAFDTTTNYTLMRGASRNGVANFSATVVDGNGAPIESRYNTPTVVLTGNAVQLQVTGAAANRVWTGATDNAWNAQDSGSAGTSNWSGGDELFMQLDNATFNNSGGGGAVDVTETVLPGTMTVSNAAYHFSGSPIHAGPIAINSNASATFENEVSGSAITVATGATASFSGTVGGDVTVRNTGTLAGTGTFQNNVIAQAGSSLRVGGASAGDAMTVEGNVSLESGSTIWFDIAESGVNDQLVVLGDLTVANGFVLSVSLDGGASAGSLSAGDRWDLLNFRNALGTFDTRDFILPPGLPSNLRWDASNLLVDGVLAIASTADFGDFDGDGAVKGADFLLWQRGESPHPASAEDLAAWQANFGADLNLPDYQQIVSEQSPLAYWRLNADTDADPGQDGFQFLTIPNTGANATLTANLAGVSVSQTSSPGLNDSDGYPGLDSDNRWLTLDGSSISGLAIQPQSPVRMGSEAGSVSFWMKTAGTNDIQILFYGTDTPESDTTANGFGSANELHLHMEADGELGIFINGSSSNTRLTTSGAYDDDAWHHVVGTWDMAGDEVVLYVDGGTDLGGETIAGSHVGNDFLLSTRQFFGQPVADQRVFDGSVDELAIWDVPLTAAEVRRQYLAALGAIQSLATSSSANMAVPEPSSLALVALAAAACLSRRRSSFTLHSQASGC